MHLYAKKILSQRPIELQKQLVTGHGARMFKHFTVEDKVLTAEDISVWQL